MERFLISEPRIAIPSSRLLGEQVARLEERLTDLALRPMTARVASTLLNLASTAPAGRFGQNRPIRLTHEIAGLLGATREATSKTLAEFAAQGIIRQGRGRITIQNTAALRSKARNPA
ncbi:Crp/Fnr family transcriptional regulator [Arthrobacter sp. ISL-5]|uniref:Crp/Fnr family transcriptional regulator n=1 Tax=Arthrobacter sp. ISL-5 TaxID=2819111 RepID=UPI0027DF7751|nr:Crp/Fnr family transcriptional regulator [Arthrobacter sp. ISL-5]